MSSSLWTEQQSEEDSFFVVVVVVVVVVVQYSSFVRDTYSNIYTGRRTLCF